MSTKTTLKRIALVAVSTLGLSGLAVIAAPSASASVSTITIGTIPSARVGETVVVPVTVNLSSASAANDTITVMAKIASAPSTAGGQTANSVLGTNGTTGTTNSTQDPRLWVTTSAVGTIAAGSVNTALTASSTDPTDDVSYFGSFDNTAPTTAGDTVAGSASGNAGDVAVSTLNTPVTTTLLSKTVYLAMRPDVAGTYSVIVSAQRGSQVDPAFSYVAGQVSQTVTITTSSSGPASITLTKINESAEDEAFGSLIRVNILDAAGNPAILTNDEAINVTVSSGRIAKATVAAGAFTSVDPTTSTDGYLTKANFSNGMAFVNVESDADGAVTVTATGTGGLSSSLTTSTVTTFVDPVDLTATSFLSRSSTTVVASGWYPATAGTSTGTYYVRSTATSATIGVGFADIDADKIGSIDVTDFAGKIAGAPTTGNSLRFTKYFTTTGTEASDLNTAATVSLTFGALGTTESDGVTGFDFAIDGLSATFTVYGQTSAGTNGSISVTPSNIRAATGGSVSIKATVRDQFYSAIAGSATTITVSGRNGARTSESLLTDSTGSVTTTITDAGTSGSTDTVTFTNGTTGTASITWGDYTVGSVTVEGGSTEADEDYYEGYTLTSIGDRASGPHGNPKTFTATVKDANGLVLSGVPVTWSVNNGAIYVTATTNYTTTYTNANGVATGYVIGWVEGKQTVTATAGGKSGTDYLTWDQNTASTARSVSGAASGNKVTATVKDRYGNTVYNVTVKAKTSLGYFGNGSDSTTCSTDYDGTCSLFLNGASGSATVTLSLDKATYPQSYDLAGFVAGTAVTAPTAGTTVGTGSTLSAAGVNSVSVTVAATDAAATAAEAASDAALEAIDAANAATDAANLAAEAADAATVAAEEARDAADAATAAVEALASEVATLIAGLKAQITTLANTVAKIAKRVRA